MRAPGCGFLLLVCGCVGVGHGPSSGPSVQSLGDGQFDSIAVMGSLDVSVTVGPEEEVVLEGAGEDVDAVDVRVRGGRLEIGHTRNGWGGGPVRVRVTMPSMREAAVAGSGDLIVEGVDAEQFVATVTGSGGLRASGQADDVRLSIAGSGDIDLAGLTAKTAHVIITGSGNAKLHASEHVDGSVAGSGDVGVAGGARCQVDVAGSGDVDC